MDELTYAKPTPADKEAVLAFMELFYAAGETTVNGSGGLDFYKDYEVWLAYLGRIASGEEEGFVPSVIYLARDGAGAIVGILDVRPGLPKEKEAFGHLGYAVAPPYRGHGYATAMARWALDFLRRAGVASPLVDCYADNLASKRVIEKAGFAETGRRIEEETGQEIIEWAYLA